MLSIKKTLFIFIILHLIFSSFRLKAQSIPGSDAAGRWDLTLKTPSGEELPSWVEIKTSGVNTLVGRYVGVGGSARPISEINYKADEKAYSFSIPPQWSDSKDNQRFEFKLKGNKLYGTLDGLEQNKTIKWDGVRAPDLNRKGEVKWDKAINLLDNQLSKWNKGENNQFQTKDGVLTNQKSGSNLVTKQKFEDFKLHVEFRYPEGSNSGIYLRGRYEVQVMDSYGMKPESHLLGGLYGFIDPIVNAAKKAGEWQTYDITLRGRMVTIVLNGTKVICNRPIPGITGGALDSNEAEPGPIMLQGDHGSVKYRNIIITPAQK